MRRLLLVLVMGLIVVGCTSTLPTQENPAATDTIPYIGIGMNSVRFDYHADTTTDTLHAKDILGETLAATEPEA